MLQGTLKIWGTDEVGSWEEKHECKAIDVGAWLEYYEHDYEGYEFRKDQVSE